MGLSRAISWYPQHYKGRRGAACACLFQGITGITLLPFSALPLAALRYPQRCYLLSWCIPFAVIVYPLNSTALPWCIPLVYPLNYC